MKWDVLAAAIEQVRVPCFLVCGSLLGAVRHGGPIPWDDDIDLGILESDRHRVPNHLEFRQRLGSNEAGWEYAITINGTPVDLFFVHQEPSMSWFNVGGCARYEYPPIRSLITTLVGPLMVSLPANYEDCLVANYGPDWQTPRREWNWKDAPCCKPLPTTL